MAYESKEEECSITESLVDKHPLKPIIVDMCLKTWQSILNGKINSFLNLKIQEMSLSPQAVSNLFHDILPEYIVRYAKGWKKGIMSDEKDLESLEDNFYSIEIKISSSKGSIFGNRSYGQKSSNSKKSKSGYYLAINIDKLSELSPSVRLIRLGWLDYADWISQLAQTGQQARLSKDVMAQKFITLYRVCFYSIFSYLTIFLINFYTYAISVMF